MKGLRCANNFNFASCFDNIQEVFEFTKKTYVQDFISDVCEQYIWTDIKKSVSKEN